MSLFESKNMYMIARSILEITCNYTHRLKTFLYKEFPNTIQTLKYFNFNKQVNISYSLMIEYHNILIFFTSTLFILFYFYSIKNNKNESPYINNSNYTKTYKPLQQMGSLTRIALEKKTEDDDFFDNKSEIIKNIQTHINDINNTLRTENKKKKNKYMFSYILKNIKFISNYPYLELKIRNKLIEYHTVEKWDYASDMYEKMFNEPIPSEFVESI